MATPREEYQTARNRLDALLDDGEIHPDDHDAITELCDAYDEKAFSVQIPVKENGQQESFREPLTLANWMRQLKEAAKEIRLTDSDKDTVNKYTESLLKEKDLASGTVRGYQSVLRVFYNYHDDLGISRTDVHRVQQKDTSVKPADMLTEDEIHELRQATDHARDLAMFDMLLYTGQRSAALTTLRIKDVDFDTGRFKLNEDADGLKGANDHIRWRSLLLAESSLQDWINKYHPDPKPDHYVFTAKGIYNSADPETPLTRGTPQGLMDNLKERTEIDKPLHPHMLRHNFVNLAINRYDMDPHYVKLHIGHSPDSRVMETTYQHLTDDDVSRAAEEAFGIRKEKEESPLTPARCPRCSEPLPDTAKACAACGLMITPDAVSAKETLEEREKEAKDDAETLEDYKDADAIANAIEDDPKLAAQLMDKLSELSEE